jgi:hypothetical protein
VVFFHGFNCAVTDGMKLIGQLWTLGDFPPHLVPFVFGWPGGKGLGYFTSCKRAESDEVAAQFTAFVTSLIDAGCCRLHVIGHSMGARTFLSSLPKLTQVLTLAPGAQQTASPGDAPGKKIPLATTLLMNPDSPIDRFVSIEFARLRRVCDHITLYADHSDGALWWSEIVHREKSLGKTPAGLVQVVDAATEMPPISPNEPRSVRSSIGVVREHVSFGVDGTQRPERKAPPIAPEGKRVMPLDMDVVDVSWMDNNVHSVRHNFFNINRWMIDDLREIIITQKRARHRSARMTHRYANVWSFLAAPSYVVNP